MSPYKYRLGRPLIIAFVFSAFSLYSMHRGRDRIIDAIVQSVRDSSSGSSETRLLIVQSSANDFIESRPNLLPDPFLQPLRLAPWDAATAAGGHHAIETSCQVEIIKAQCQDKLPLYNCLTRYNNAATQQHISTNCKHVLDPCKGDKCRKISNAFQPALNTIEMHQSEELLQRIHDVFAKAGGLEYWMAAGSSIGSLYHHSRIPWDDDIDMYCHTEDVELVLLQLKLDGLGVRHPDNKNHPVYKVFDTTRPAIRGSEGEHSYPFVDVFPIQCDADLCIEKNEYVETHGNSISYPKDWIFPLKWRPFGRLSLPFPNKLTDTVENRYGYDAKKFCIKQGYSHKVERFLGRDNHLNMNCTDLPIPPALVVSVTDNTTIFGGGSTIDRPYIRPWATDLPKVTVEHLNDGGKRLGSVTFYDGNEIRRSYADGLPSGKITFDSASHSTHPLLIPFLLEERESYARNVAGRTAKELNLEVIPMLDTPEVGNDFVNSRVVPGPRRLRIGEWNAERGGNWDVFPRFLPNADIIILNEMDWGMARSGNVHTIRSMAKSLQMNYAYGVEFMELTNGDAKEIEATAGNTNTAGYHGNAVLSRWPVSDAIIVRLHPLYDKLFVEKDKGMDRGERRLGGRMALFATTHIGNDDILLISVHSQAGSNGELLKDDVMTICKEIKRRNATNVLVGGDTGPPITTGLVSECGFHPLEKTNKKKGLRFEPTWRVDCPSHGPPQAKFSQGDWLLARGPGFPLAEKDTSLSVFYPYRLLKGNKYDCISDHAIIALETNFAGAGG